MRNIAQTYCRNCPAACGLLVETEDNRIVSVSGDRDHALSGGYMCIKGAMSRELHEIDVEDRKPRKRLADGRFVTMDVEAALDEIYAALTRIIERHGPEAVALYHGTGVKMNTLGMMALKPWLRELGSPYLYSSSTVDQSAKWVAAGRLGAFPTGKHMFSESDVVMLVGVNPAVSHMGMFVLPFSYPLRALREARRNGSKLIVVDPRRTETAKQADIHLQIRPGEDVALFAGMIRLVLERGWEDKPFCAQFVDHVEVLREAVALYTPEYAAARAGIEVGLLEEATRLFATSARRSATSGTGPNMSPYSNLAEHLIEALNAICGAYRREGDTIRSAGAFRKAPPTRTAQPLGPNRTWEKGPKCFSVDAGMLGGEFPTSRLPAEIRGKGDRRIRALFVIGGNPLMALGDPDGTLAAFKSLELLVTVDPVISETAALSHYFIPTKLPYERYDLTAIQDAIFSEPFAQVTEPTVAPPASVIDDWEFFWGLSRRMGKTLSLCDTKVGQAASTEGGIDLDMVHKPTTEHLVQQICEAAGLSYEELKAHRSGMRVKRDPIVVVAPAGDNRCRLDVMPEDVAAELRSYGAEVDDPRYPYRLISRRLLETMNSAYRDLPTTRHRYPLNPAFMSPGDMNREGLQNGDQIRIVSPNGAIVGYVSQDPSLTPGVISMSHMWGKLDPRADPDSQTGSFTGRLVSLQDNLEAVNFMPRQSAIPVAIRIHDKASVSTTTN